MKQILQSLSSGETLLVETPVPHRSREALLLKTSRTLVSLGTEKLLIDFGKAGWIAKARQQPDKVRQVLQKIRTDGLLTTLDAVSAKLNQPIPLGYCNVGHVVECEENAPFQLGDRVASNGPHAEWVSVPYQLCARIPDEVSDDEAAFTVVGAIGLQGIRLLAPTLGERIAVFGLGLIGLLTVQMLRANGCHVLGIDMDERKLELARSFGAQTVSLAQGQDPIVEASHWTRGEGIDGVLITASTKSQELIHQAATMCRKRGRVVLVGVVGLNLQRADFYEKELSFQVSCSYGPGRYDSNYEKKGLDYPIGFVRWTEQRNFEAVLDMMASRKLDVQPLVTHRFTFDDALEAYQVVSSGSAMGILLQYSDQDTPQRTVQLTPTKKRVVSTDRAQPQPKHDSKIETIQLGVIGAGGFTTRMLLPTLAKSNIRFKTIVSSTGVSASYAGRKFGFEKASSETAAVFEDPEINTILIATPHNTHSSLILQALAAGKHVFVEKPLALTVTELDDIYTASRQADRCKWMVGFNRRFSPHVNQIQQWLKSITGPIAIQITINAGVIDANHWTQDPQIGGGRLVGEACHFIDLARFIASSPITSVGVQAMGGEDGKLGDTALINLRFANESIASIAYLSNGHRSYPKERIEVFAGGRIAVCNNFRLTTGLGFFGKCKTWKQDKGHSRGIMAFLDAIKSDSPLPIPEEEMLEVSRVAIEVAAKAREQLGTR